MKVLCLASMGANAETFKSVLSPIAKELEDSDGVSFHYLAGSVVMPETVGMEKYYGPKPHLRFLQSVWPGATDEQHAMAIGRAPKGLQPEEMFRFIERRLPPKKDPHLQLVLEGLSRVFEEEGPFDCILGHSEGATIAATFVAEYLGKCAAQGDVAPLKCAIFIGGSVPFTSDNPGFFLADNEREAVITIPTCHILAYNDNLLFESLALFHLCREEAATIVDHGRGHPIPQDRTACQLMVDGIRDLIARTPGCRV